MALDIFKKKEEAAPAAPAAPPGAPAPPSAPPAPAAPAPVSAGTPTDYILSLQQQGLTQNQIIQTLQRQGYSQAQVSDALNQAAVKGQVTGNQPPPIAGQPQQGPSILPPAGTNFEEIAESIIQEKWQDFQKELEKDTTWKEHTESRIGVIEGQMGELRNTVDNLHKAIVSKIGDYDKSLLSVGTEIKAMEKVFQQILPTLTDNVTELSRITKSIKKK